MVGMVNRDLKKTVWDSINRNNFMPLFIRVMQANVSVCVNFTSVKFFTLTTTAIVNQTAPLLTTVLAAFLLNEKLLCSNVIVLLIAFMGVILMIIGGAEA